MVKPLRYKLRNGLRVIMVPQAGSLTATAMVSVEAGSKYETKDINGLSHFLEHMCFKGTTKRPTALDITTELDGLGAQYNAFTSQESTSYYAKVKKDNFGEILDVVADMYIDPKFNAGEIEKERGVIIQELNMYEDMPMRRVQEFFMHLVYGDQPAGWDIGGKKEIIKRLTRDDFLVYRKRHYVPQATIVTLSGKFEPKQTLKKIERYFSVLSPGPKGKKLPVKESQAKPNELVHFKDVDQSHIVMGFRAFSAHDKRKYALQILAEILGGGMSSRLFQKVRDELGAAYYVRCEPDLYTDHGLIAMSAGLDHAKIEAAIRAALGEFTRLKNEKVSDKDLKKAKEHFIGDLFLSLEGSDEIAGFYAGQELLGAAGLKTPEEVAKKINAVTAAEIQAVAKDVFKDKNLNLAVIGPFKKRSFRGLLRV
jgi:predicted Zn-dependent peptidase